MVDALILISFYVAAAGYDNHDCHYLDATRFLVRAADVIFVATAEFGSYLYSLPYLMLLPDCFCFCFLLLLVVMLSLLCL